MGIAVVKPDVNYFYYGCVCLATHVYFNCCWPTWLTKKIPLLLWLDITLFSKHQGFCCFETCSHLHFAFVCRHFQIIVPTLHPLLVHHLLCWCLLCDLCRLCLFVCCVGLISFCCAFFVTYCILPSYCFDAFFWWNTTMYDMILNLRSWFSLFSLSTDKSWPAEMNWLLKLCESGHCSVLYEKLIVVIKD